VPVVQQPATHVLTSQEQVPFVLSQTPFEQGAHIEPAVPQSDGVSDPNARHVPLDPPSQHPLGHDVTSQTHVPFALSHSLPVGHAAQLAPMVPHDVFDSEPQASHAPAAVQQPSGQDVESQAHWPFDLLHSCPPGQDVQVAPPAPHSVLFSPESRTHDPLLQQPTHPDPPHVHTPFVQESPVPQVLHCAPPVPHAVVGLCWA
jgi:hypothetical protein